VCSWRAGCFRSAIPTPFAEPQYETDEYYATTGFATTIDEAAKKATCYMIDYLVETRGLSREQAYMPASLAGDLKIAETVDVPHMLVTMHMPKSIFVSPGSGRVL
jgi:acetamidase/formamidase